MRGVFVIEDGGASVFAVKVLMRLGVDAEEAVREAEVGWSPGAKLTLMIQ